MVIQPFMHPHAGDIETSKQPVELFLAQREYRIVHLARPLEAVLLQALVPQAKTRLIPIDDLELVAAAVRKDKQRTREWRALHGVFDDDHQAVNVLAEINRVPMQIHSRSSSRK